MTLEEKQKEVKNGDWSEHFEELSIGDRIVALERAVSDLEAKIK